MRNALLLCCLVLALSACEEKDASSLRITLDADLAGEVVVSGLSTRSDPAPFEDGNLEWKERARVEVSRGRFQSLEKEGLRVMDVSVELLGKRSERWLRVRLPRGKDARWPWLLAPDDAARETARRAFAPEEEDSSLGRNLKLSLRLPKEAKLRSHRVWPESMGKSVAEDGELSLVIPLAKARAEGDGDDIYWDLIFRL